MSHVRLSALLLAATLAASLNACGDGKALTEPVPPVGPAASLSSIVDSVRLAYNLPAMGAAIVTLEDGIVATAVAGTRRAAGGPSVTTEDLWHLGSNTKAITSLLAAVAVSQNRIEWTTTIPQVFPELTNIRPEYRGVTLRDLLSHQSGLSGISPAVFGRWKDLPVVAQRDSAVRWLVQQPPDGPRGTFVYSNWGYSVAGAMLERVFGTPFEAATTAQVFGPLGMTNAGFGAQAEAGSTTQPVAHFRDTNGWRALENFDVPPPVMAPAGAAHMSLPSWGRLVREVLRVEAGTSTLVPAAIAQQTTTPVIDDGGGASYGMGWGVTTRQWANGKVLFHSGTNTGNVSNAVLAPQRNVAFIVTTNGYDPNGRTNAVTGMTNRLIAFYQTGR